MTRPVNCDHIELYRVYSHSQLQTSPAPQPHPPGLVARGQLTLRQQWNEIVKGACIVQPTYEFTYTLDVTNRERKEYAYTHHAKLALAFHQVHPMPYQLPDPRVQVKSLHRDKNYHTDN